jgi:Chaperone for flagella basal body P-ring formation
MRPLTLFTAARATLAFACLFFTASSARPAAASDPVEVTVTSSRVALEDVMPNCPPAACKIDLGPAPPPQVSWLVDGSVIRGALESAGEDRRSLQAVRAVRVVSAARVLNPAEAGDFLRASVESVLPAGVTLTSLEAKSKLTLPLRGSAGATTLPKLPRRAGAITTTAMVDIQLDGTLVRRVAVLCRLMIAASAARAAVPRGQALTLVIERRSATISTDGIALRDAEIGEVAPFRVQRTGRVLNALIKSQGMAQVLEVD